MKKSKLKLLYQSFEEKAVDVKSVDKFYKKFINTEEAEDMFFDTIRGTQGSSDLKQDLLQPYRRSLKLVGKCARTELRNFVLAFQRSRPPASSVLKYYSRGCDEVPASEAQIKATACYNKKTYERIAFDVRRDAEVNGDFIRSHAEATGEGMNRFLKRAVTETIERDKAKSES